MLAGVLGGGTEARQEVGVWTTLLDGTIVARGHRLSVTFNSVRTVDVEHTGRTRGAIALQCATGAVKLRRVEIRPLSPVS
jgi:hypothetical protein